MESPKLSNATTLPNKIRPSVSRLRHHVSIRAAESDFIKGPLSYKYIMTSVDVYESILYITNSFKFTTSLKCVSYISK